MNLSRLFETILLVAGFWILVAGYWVLEAVLNDKS
jgi:hypothetical protein